MSESFQLSCIPVLFCVSKGQKRNSDWVELLWSCESTQCPCVVAAIMRFHRIGGWCVISTFGPGWNGHHFVDGIFKYILENESIWSTHHDLVSHTCIMKYRHHFPMDAYMRRKFLYSSYTPGETKKTVSVQDAKKFLWNGVQLRTKRLLLVRNCTRYVHKSTDTYMCHQTSMGYYLYVKYCRWSGFIFCSRTTHPVMSHLFEIAERRSTWRLCL